MNQLTKKFQETRASARIGKIIYEKDREATEMLKKASCLQKWLTKIKQNWGNSRFKNENPLFVGKEAVFRSILAMRQVNNPPPIVVQPPIVEREPEPTPKKPEPVPVKVEPKKEVKEKVKQELTPQQKELNFISGKDFKEALKKVSKGPSEYYELLEDYRKRGFFDRACLPATTLCQGKIPKECLNDIFSKLVYNACRESKDIFDYLNIRAMAIIASYDHDVIFLTVAERFLAEGDLAKATEVLGQLNNKNSEGAERINVNIGMAYIVQLKEGDHRLTSLKSEYWLKKAKINWEFKRFGITRDAFVVAAKILWKQEKVEEALKTLVKIAIELSLLDSNDSDELAEYLNNGGRDFNHALEIATRKTF